MLAFFALMVAMATITDITIEPCSSSPNCVSSQASGNHFIEALLIIGEAHTAFERLKKVLEQRADTSIVAADDKIIRVEFKTVLGFVDDGVFVLGSEGKVIQIRSASRLGYWDLGKNRRWIEEIRKEYMAR